MDEDLSPILVDSGPHPLSKSAALGLGLVFLGLVATLVTGFLQFSAIPPGFDGPPVELPVRRELAAAWIGCCVLVFAGLASAVNSWFQPQRSNLLFITFMMGLPGAGLALVFTYMFVVYPLQHG